MNPQANRSQEHEILLKPLALRVGQSVWLDLSAASLHREGGLKS